MSSLEIVQAKLSDRYWRLNNLYHIIDKTGEKRLFKFNWAQEELYRNTWYCNVILKARQLGISTYVTILFLDTCLFNSNTACGVIAHTREDAEQIFNKAKIAYDSLPAALQELRPVHTDNVRELKFSNGSHFRVGTSLRSATFQYLHISEFGKICAKFPDKAKEIVTGSLNTIASGQYVFIESTAEGKEGYFYDICMRAQQINQPTPLDFRFHFFPWHKDPTYKIDSSINIPDNLRPYFQKLELAGIRLSDEQKAWYALKKTTQRDDMLREYPSIPEEAFQSSAEGLYYGEQLLQAKEENRIGHVPYDMHAKTFTAWDLGISDSTCVWIYQVVGKEIHLIDYIEDSGKPLAYYIDLLKKKNYSYEKHFVPHDAAARELGTGLSRVEVARNLGCTFTVAKMLSIQEGIDAARSIFNRCWFDAQKCSQGLRALENYKREWNERLGCWDSKPLHNFASHGADAFRILAITLNDADKKRMTEEECWALQYSKGRYTSFNAPWSSSNIHTNYYAR